MDFIQYYYLITVLSVIFTIYYFSKLYKNMTYDKIDKVFIELLKTDEFFIEENDNENKNYQYFIRMIKYMQENELNDLKEILQIQVDTKKNYYTSKEITQLEINIMIEDIEYINNFILSKKLIF